MQWKYIGMKGKKRWVTNWGRKGNTLRCIYASDTLTSAQERWRLKRIEMKMHGGKGQTMQKGKGAEYEKGKE